jgi:hypothetical protein
MEVTSSPAVLLIYEVAIGVVTLVVLGTILTAIAKRQRKP